MKLTQIQVLILKSMHDFKIKHGFCLKADGGHENFMKMIKNGNVFLKTLVGKELRSIFSLQIINLNLN